MAKPAIQLNAADVEQLILESGFPLELDVASELQTLGFDVGPAYRFYRHREGKDSELDVVATLREQIDVPSGPKVQAVLRLAVECKDNSLPYVCFGLPHSRQIQAGSVDPDHQFCHVTSTRDSVPNKLAIPVFDPRFGVDVKSQHHQFQGPLRFHALTGFELVGGKAKLHTPGALQSALEKLGMYVDHFQRIWPRPAEQLDLEKLTGGPTLVVLFLMIVHTGEQYQYTKANPKAVAADHTTVFLNLALPDRPVSYVVDVVRRPKLAHAVQKVRESFSVMVKQHAPLLVRLE